MNQREAQQWRTTAYVMATVAIVLAFGAVFGPWIGLGFGLPVGAGLPLAVERKPIWVSPSDSEAGKEASR